MEENQKIEDAIGEAVRRHRNQRRLTLDALAGLADISSAYLSRVEHGERSPSIATLVALSEALGVPLGALLPSGQDGVAVVRGPRTAVRSADLDVRPLSNRVDSQLTPIRISVPRGRDWKAPVTHPGEEWIYVLSGILRVEYGTATDDLGPGDAIHFSASEPHRLQALVEAEAIVISHIEKGAEQ